MKQLLTGTVSLDLLPGAMLRACATIDRRVVIEFLTPAHSSITVELNQAKDLLYTLSNAIKDAEK